MRVRKRLAALSFAALALGGVAAVAPQPAEVTPHAEAAPGACTGKKFDKFHTRGTDTVYSWINWMKRIPPVGNAKVRNAETIGYRWCPTLVGNQWIGPGRVKIMWTKFCHSHYRATGAFAGTDLNPTQSPYFESITYDTTYFDNFEDNWVMPIEVRKLGNNGEQSCSGFRRIPYAEREWIFVGDVGMAGYTSALRIHQNLQTPTDDMIRTANGLGAETAWFAPSGDPTLATYAPGVAEPVTDPTIPSTIGNITGTYEWEPPQIPTCYEGYIWNPETNMCGLPWAPPPPCPSGQIFWTGTGCMPNSPPCNETIIQCPGSPPPTCQPNGKGCPGGIPPTSPLCYTTPAMHTQYPNVPPCDPPVPPPVTCGGLNQVSCVDPTGQNYAGICNDDDLEATWDYEMRNYYCT